MSGRLIVLEGPDNGGKTTLAKDLLARFTANNIPAIIRREPGSTGIATKIRELLMDSENSICPLSELFLFEAARADFVETELKPALKEGYVVICDRYTNSTMAYQVDGRGLDAGMVDGMNSIATGGLQADITFIVDVTVEIAIQRANEANRMEQTDIDFRKRVRKSYILQSKHNNHVLLDGCQSPRKVFYDAMQILKTEIAELTSGEEIVLEPEVEAKPVVIPEVVETPEVVEEVVETIVKEVSVEVSEEPSEDSVEIDTEATAEEEEVVVEEPTPVPSVKAEGLDALDTVAKNITETDSVPEEEPVLQAPKLNTHVSKVIPLHYYVGYVNGQIGKYDVDNVCGCLDAVIDSEAGLPIVILKNAEAVTSDMVPPHETIIGYVDSYFLTDNVVEFSIRIQKEYKEIVEVSTVARTVPKGATIHMNKIGFLYAVEANGNMATFTSTENA